MTGQRSVPKRRRSTPWSSRRFGYGLVTLLTLFVPSLQCANVAGFVPATAHSSGFTSAVGVDHPATQAEQALRLEHRVLSAAEVPNLISGGSAQDNADECPGDVETIQQETSMPPLPARAATRDAIEVTPSAILMTDGEWAGDGSPPSSVYRCNPDGRGPPARV